MFFNSNKTSFIQYADIKNLYVVMGDPVGIIDDFPTLINDFIKYSKISKKNPIFYEVSKNYLSYYLDVGFHALKLGEEGHVNLKTFNLLGSERSSLRNNYNKFIKEGYTVRIIQGEDRNQLFPVLKDISDQWLKNKNSHEKSFSLGKFDLEFLQYFPIFILEKNETILAFSTVFKTKNNYLGGLDLIRYSDNAPKNTMEFLILNSIFWFQKEGYEKFSLGMAPLSDSLNIETYSLWKNLEKLVYEHGNYFYHFKGLRFFKEKFKPTWESRYLIYRDNLTLPLVLKNIFSLISNKK